MNTKKKSYCLFKRSNLDIICFIDIYKQMKLRMRNWLLWVLTTNMTPYFTYGYSYIHWLTECHLLHCSQVAAETKCSFEWLLYSTQARFWTSFSKWLQKSELQWLIAALGSGLRLFAWGTEQATGHSTNQSPSFCHCIESSTARAAMSLETTFSEFSTNIDFMIYCHPIFWLPGLNTSCSVLIF